MPSKPTITLVGPGRLGASLARALHAVGYTIDEMVFRPGGQSQTNARRLSRTLRSHAVTFDRARFSAGIIWICVGDSAIPTIAAELGSRDWNGKVAFHSSGALASDVLEPLRRRGASVAAVHPMMSFVSNVRTPLKGVTFSLEGDSRAVRQARRIVADLGASSFNIRKQAKPLYHAFGAFTSPLLIAALAAGERIAEAAGMKPKQIRAAVVPIFEQTLRNYLRGGAAAAFTGPLVRGDVEIIRKHLDALRAVPESRAVYVALVRSALATLPVKNAVQISRVLRENS